MNPITSLGAIKNLVDTHGTPYEKSEFDMLKVYIESSITKKDCPVRLKKSFMDREGFVNHDWREMDYEGFVNHEWREVQ